ncbi:MAG: type III pantothenate kinase [Gammaproteobacteria bacterium]
MLFCLDIGNAHIFAGLFEDENLTFNFRCASNQDCTSDELGIFLKSYLRDVGVELHQITHIALCSVVPNIDYSVRAMIHKFFSKDPFILQMGVKTGLQIKYKNPMEVGADRIANAIAAAHLFPKKDIIIINLDAVTTFEVISDKGAFLGGAMIPGLQMQMNALNEHTASLPRVRIVKPLCAMGQSTIANIQSGLFYGHKGAIQEIIKSIKSEMSDNTAPIIIGTGVFASLYEQENIFDVIIPELVLQGLRIAHKKFISV